MSTDLETGGLAGSDQSHPKSSTTRWVKSWKTITLAYQTLGVVYGDLGTSPLYVYPTMNFKSPQGEDFLGTFSIIFWTLTLIGLAKYVFIVLHADDHGEGGTFALYSLLCQHLKTTIKGHKYGRMLSDSKLSHFSKTNEAESPTAFARFIERRKSAQRLLLFVAMLGTCMLIGDGILTPAVSVLSAMAGIATATPKINQSTVVWLSAAVLVALFLLQRFGTKCVSFVFSPIMAIWLITTPLIGLYNIVIHYPQIYKALSPHYIVTFFQRNGKDGWLALGGTVLCITGAEAMFADLGHFTKSSIQVAFAFMIYPSVLLTYAGQSAYLVRHPGDHREAFYKFLPRSIYWPMFVVSTLAAIVASQGLISAAFSIIKQSIALDYFPPVTMVHTSQDKEGQVYSPQVNYCLMVLCLAVLFGFQGGPEIGNAFGVAVIWVMLITSSLITLVMLIIWRTPVILALVYITVYGTLEGVYLSSVLTKLREGGWFPFGISVILALAMFSWHHGREKISDYEMINKVTVDSLDELFSRAAKQRVPGLCLFYTDLVHGVPPIMRHYVNNVRSLHQVIVFITIRYVPVRTVLPDERFILERCGYAGVYRCVAQYGYTDVLEGEEFVSDVIEALAIFVASREDHEELDSDGDGAALVSDLWRAKAAGAVHVMAKADFRMSEERSGWFERLVLDGIYRFLRNNCQMPVAALKIAPQNVIEIGMMYEI
ncbi:probable potassium transporter 17 [Selaginella moellendorffii]|uniref:probable potassium transporter 17 n=1 Tax=Selaginella moellendorffii TaxID=88036 RepID=UPI000D1CAAA6|nr:probable potassium transporter 17 [Selaginella moellendorffii]|eukprot:XP_002974525.2 probable potassium transporter 17 [Selaginella moellendorffii]